MIKITALGELLIDFTPIASSNEFPSFNALPGGAPCNFLAAASSCGAQTSFIGKVGDDAFGKMLSDVLSSHGIDTSGLVFDRDVFTTLAFVTLDDSGDRSFSFARKPGADTCLKTDDINYSLIDSCAAFHFGTLSMTDEPSCSATFSALDYAVSKGKIITFDPNYRDKLWDDEEKAKQAIINGLKYADIVKISDNEAYLISGLSPEESAKYIVEKYKPSIVLVTCGKEGCVYANSVCSGSVPNYTDVTTVDTTGAGDIFGGFAITTLLGYNEELSTLAEEKLRYACRLGCTAASLSTEHHGGISSVPSLDNVLSHI